MPFQNIVAQKLVQAAVGTSASTVYITPPNTQVYIKDICICNTNTNSSNINLYIVPSGKTAGITGTNANALFYNLDIPSHTTTHWTGTQILNAGDTIQVKSDNNGGLVLTISGAQAV